MDPPRKKLRRVVNSCLECRRRKIRCDSSVNGSSRCSACDARDISCEKFSETDEVPDATKSELGARLRRMENLLQRLTDEPANGYKHSLSHDSGDGVLSAPIEADSHPPLMTLFDNAVFGHQEPSSSSSETGPRESSCSSTDLQDAKQEKLRLMLCTLLPSQQDADQIATATNAWALGRTLEDGSVYPYIDIASVARGSPLVIARSLMLLAIFIQQLPPDFDTSCLNFSSSLQSTLQKYLQYVTDLVTNNDDLACTMQGLECLLLQTMLYINDGNLRRAWLAARRALYVAQFLGLSKSYLRYTQTTGIQEDTHKARSIMWMRTVMADRYLAPIVGLPSGVGPDCFGDDHRLELFSDPSDLLDHRLCAIAGLISARNQKEPPPGYTLTLDIDEKMDEAANTLGDMLTKIPNLSVVNKSQAEATARKTVLCQMWFYFLKLCLHIPWMLKAFSDGKFEYSRLACLHASREKLKRYRVLRGTNNTQGTTRVVDFGTVIAATTLILNAIGSASRSFDIKQLAADEHLVSETLQSMRATSYGPREFMARQGIEVIESLLALKNSEPGNSAHKVIRLTIPFFGPVTIHRDSSRPSTGLAHPDSRAIQSSQPAGAHSAAVANDALQHGGQLSALPDFNSTFSFDYAEMMDPGWLPPLQAWDFENVADWDNVTGLWDVSTWEGM